MKLFYCDSFVLPLPPGHRFPMDKYRLLRERLEQMPIFCAADFCLPPAVTEAQLLLVHEPGYVRRMLSGAVTEREEREIGFPWSPALIERSRRSSGATLEACRAALQEGCAANLAGGTHHAFADHGEGFCVFNDSAIAIRVLQAEGLVSRALIVDLDVHQGNGTARIFAGDNAVFTFSMHGDKNYPTRKQLSDLDIPLADGMGDSAYLALLQQGLARALAAGPFDLAIYLAGVDPHENDRLGRLKLTEAGLAQRDSMTLHRLRSAGLPVAITMGGGYGTDLETLVRLHANTVALGAQWCRTPSSAAYAGQMAP